VNYSDRLRLLALNDANFIESCMRPLAQCPEVLTGRDVALARLGGLLALGGAVESYGEIVDAALDAGVTVDEIVEVIVRMVPIIGTPRAVAEAPKLAMALGYDVDAALEQREP